MANRYPDDVQPDLSGLSYEQLHKVREETDRLLNTPPPILPYEAAEEMRQHIYRFASSMSDGDREDLRDHLREKGASRPSVDQGLHGSSRTRDESKPAAPVEETRTPRVPDKRLPKTSSKEKTPIVVSRSLSRSQSRDRDTDGNRAAASGHENKRGRFSSRPQSDVNPLRGYRIPKRSRSPLNEPANARNINPARQVLEDYVTNMSDALHGLLEEHRSLGGVLGHMSRTLNTLRTERCLWLRHQSRIQALSAQVALFIRDLDPVFWFQACQSDNTFRKVSREAVKLALDRIHVDILFSGRRDIR